MRLTRRRIRILTEPNHSHGVERREGKRGPHVGFGRKDRVAPALCIDKRFELSEVRLGRFLGNFRVPVARNIDVHGSWNV
jgi:hypothetical protein